MFPTLSAEMARAGLNAKQLAERATIKYETLLKKLSGKNEFTRPEMLSIKKALSLDMTLEHLFEVRTEASKYSHQDYEKQSNFTIEGEMTFS